jgi:hypothetical protein
MSTTETRLLAPSLLPATLWDADEQVLVLPPILASAYRIVIDRHNLRGIARRRDQDAPPVGGLTEEKATEHFAQAFDGSAARTQLALLDPKGEVTDASDAFVRCLAGNRVCLTDAPCGAGAAAFVFLASVAELRANGVLPREPLDVELIGAELSEPARRYAQEVFAEIHPLLEHQAIFVRLQLIRWDVTNALSNTDLIKAMVRTSEPACTRLLVVANFNGFLEREGKRRDAQPQLAELLRYSSGNHSAAIWIEPPMNRAIAPGGLFAWLRSLVTGAWRLFARESTNGTDEDPVAVSSARFREPLDPDVTARVGLAVMALSLERAT